MKGEGFLERRKSLSKSMILHGGFKTQWKCPLVLSMIVRKTYQEVVCMIYNTKTRSGLEE